MITADNLEEFTLSTYGSHNQVTKDSYAFYHHGIVEGGTHGIIDPVRTCIAKDWAELLRHLNLQVQSAPVWYSEGSVRGQKSRRNHMTQPYLIWPQC